MAVCHNWAIFESSLCKISYTSGPNVCWLFRQFWKHLLSCINFWGNFWKFLGYFIFQNLFTLVFKYTLGQNEHNFIIKYPFFLGGGEFGFAHKVPNWVKAKDVRIDNDVHNSREKVIRVSWDDQILHNPVKHSCCTYPITYIFKRDRSQPLFLYFHLFLLS